MKIIEKARLAAKSRFLQPVVKLLVQGIGAREIAMAITGAIVFGIFPVIGATTLLCTFFALRFKLNLPLIQLVNYSASPLQLLMIIPFMKAGEIFGFEKLSFSLGEIVTMVGTAPLQAISVLWTVTMQAIGAWVLIAPLLGWFLFRLTHSLVSKINLNAYRASSEQE